MQLRIHQMHERHPALTPAISYSYAEAAAVCLSRHHVPPTEIEVDDRGTRRPALTQWPPPDERQLSAWANTTDATEAGAYCCVIASLEGLRGLVAVRRAETGTGSDYYLAPVGSGINDLEDALRLEVSGIDDGDESDVRRRLRIKIRQALAGDSNLPAVAGVISFSARILMVLDAQEERR